MKEIVVSDPGDEQPGSNIIKVIYISSEEDIFY